MLEEVIKIAKKAGATPTTVSRWRSFGHVPSDWLLFFLNSGVAFDDIKSLAKPSVWEMGKRKKRRSRSSDLH